VLSNRVHEAGLHLCTDLFVQVLTQAEVSGASSYQADPMQNPNFIARETLFREKNVTKSYKIKSAFIIPTDAHYYTNYRMLKQFKKL